MAARCHHRPRDPVGGPARRRQERAVLTGLAATIRYAVGEGELALLDGRGGRLLVYAPASTDLADTRWGAVGINAGAAVVSSAATEAAEVEFRSDSLRLPLRDLVALGIPAQDLRSISFVFDRTASGVVYIGDVQLSD
ncbi:MAG TPA: hypothetical protein VFR74_10555 [Jiangellales bacterium]|nr:hypothetical protein [Jiangellales bacterium]